MMVDLFDKDIISSDIIDNSISDKMKKGELKTVLKNRILDSYTYLNEYDINIIDKKVSLRSHTVMLRYDIVDGYKVNLWISVNSNLPSQVLKFVYDISKLCLIVNTVKLIGQCNMSLYNMFMPHKCKLTDFEVPKIVSDYDSIESLFITQDFNDTQIHTTEEIVKFTRNCFNTNPYITSVQLKFRHKITDIFNDVKTLMKEIKTVQMANDCIWFSKNKL